jgi:hypothetical protein
MKSLFRRILVVLAVFASAHQTFAAITFTITPSAISNTYSGIVTLQITGLSTGGNVVVRKYLDANSNGIVDAGDILWQEFQMTDGVASVFSTGTTSITNFNVASDLDGSANGSITAKLYPAEDFSQLVVGRYLFVLLSSAGNVTNSFAVTNFPFAQSISGNVVNNGTNVPDALVILFQPSPSGGQNPQGGVVANSTGAYKIAAAPGTYLVAAAKTNFVADLTVSPTVVLNQGTIITTNVPLTNATESISGSVVDASSDTALPGLLVPIQTTNELALGFSDTNGNFSVGVTKGQWKLGNDSEALLVKGYMAFQNSMKVDTTTGSVSGVTENLTKETAIFYGKVEDPSGNPLTGTEIETYDNNDLYQSDGVVFTNGNYVASAVGGGGDQWQVDYDQHGPANYDYSQPTFDQNGGTNISAGKAIQVNVTGILATDTITGTILYNGNPVSGVGINANATINSANYSAHADTAANGTFSFNVANGTWIVSLNCNGGSDSLENILSGNFQCPNNATIVISNNNATANFTVQPAADDDQIYGHVSDNSDNPIAGVNVYANNGSGVTYTNTTDSTGYYSFFVADGNWGVSVDCGQLNAGGYSCVATQYVSTCCGEQQEQDFTTQSGGTNGYFGYSVTDGQVTITSYNGPGGAVTIPGTINNLPVTSIAGYVFDDGTVTGVTIPNSVTSIQDNAFFSCYSLTSVVIPNSVISIGNASFANCSALLSATLGTNITSIGDTAFGSCGSLTSISIPASVTSIGDDPFVGCSSLPAISVDASNPDYTSVGGVLFNYNVTSLIQYPIGNSATSYTVPASVTSIGDYAFFNSSTLTSVTIGSGVNTIGLEAFAYCPGLVSLYFLGNAPTADPTAFSGNNNSGYIDATIYYVQGATGWTTPFQGLPAVLLSESPGLPQLGLYLDGENAILFWPTNAAGFGLQSSTNLNLAGWINVSSKAFLIGDQNVVILPMTGRQQFYRLKH